MAHSCRFLIRIFQLFILFLSASSAFGHSVGEDYIFLSISKEGEIEGRFEFHFDDLKEKLDIDVDGDSADLIQANLDKSAAKVHAYIEENFEMKGDDTPISLKFTTQSVMKEVAHYAQYHFRASVPSLPDKLSFRHEMMREGDRMHRGLLVLNYNPVTDTKYGEEHVAMIFRPTDEEQVLDLREPIPDLLTPKAFIWQGILHIWIGIDHILFLVVLLLPAVLRREDNSWVPVESFGKAIFRVLKIVTLFTLAHSVSLALAALGFISLPGRLVESIIAASIILVALNNIFPRFKEGSAFVICGFGLFHGLGFASVMSDIPFRMENLEKVLIAFNVGVEIGQIAIVIVAFILLFPIRKLAIYQPGVLRLGSAAAGLMATYWFIERAFSL